MLKISNLGIALMLTLVTSATSFGEVPYEVFGNGGNNGEWPEEVDGWDGSAIRIAHDANGGVSNGVSFNSAFTGDYETLEFNFDFRIWNEDGSGDADGIGFAYADVEIFGDEADEDEQFWGGGEEPNLEGSIGVGFDTWMNAALDDIDAEIGFENGTLPNSFSLHYYGETLVSLPVTELDEGVDDDWIQNGNVKQAHILIEPGDNDEAAVTLTVTDTETGESVVPFDKEPVPDFEPYDGRIVFKARTGGEDSNHDIDNISLTHTTDGTATTVVHFGEAGPAPRIGDYNGNDLLDTGDLDLQAAEGIAGGDLKYDLNEDGVVNAADRRLWTNDLKNTWMGDSDLSGQFDSSDLVTVFAAAKYETAQAATWGQGDWNGDGKFDSGDLVEAFSNAGYEAGERPGGPNAAAVVPEPSSLVLTLLSIFGLVGFARRRNG